MASTRLYARLAVTFALVAVVVGIGSSGLLPERGARILDNGAQLTAGLAAALACWWTAKRRTGAERAWRRLMAAGMAGWTAGQLVWGYYQVFDPQGQPTPSLADVGYLTLPVFALLALLAVAAASPRPTPASLLRDRLALLLDSLIVVGSLLALTWATALGAYVQHGPESGLAFAVGLAYPVTDLVLAVMVVLLIGTRPAPRPLRPQLFLLGLGLLALSVSDSLYVTEMAGGNLVLSPLANAGFVLGPALVALAAVASAAEPEPDRPDGPPPPEWLHLLLPYVPVIATGVMIAVRTGTGGVLTPFEVYLGWLGLGLVVARQMLTIVDNTVLLSRVSEGQQRLVHQAYHDSLTGLANRALFRERLVQAVQDHHREGRHLALFFVDLDDFKLVNDSLGHGVGDRTLRSVGERLSACVRPGDAVARLGGDEFAILLDGDLTDPEAVGRRILGALAEPFTVDGHALTVSASVGLVVPDGADGELSADALLRRADAAMYAGKRRGNGQLVRYSGRTDRTGGADLPSLLATALAGDPGGAGFEVHYQPIVDLADGRTVAVEALARWHHPVAGAVDPDVFVSVAERTGLVAALDDFVLDRACADAAALGRRHGAPVDLHVNVSAGRLGRPELEEAVGRALRRHGVPAARVVLEITETRRIADLSAAAAAARRLRAAGVRLALDDFGSGFNALTQLHSLPVDIVKLDATLTDMRPDPERTGALCSSVLTICAALDVTVVAEGVESPDQASALRRVGCRLGQGYLFGPAQPLATLAGDRPAAAPAG